MFESEWSLSSVSVRLRQEVSEQRAYLPDFDYSGYYFARLGRRFQSLVDSNREPSCLKLSESRRMDLESLVASGL